jgi:S1-C subfamily serine protease
MKFVFRLPQPIILITIGLIHFQLQAQLLVPNNQVPRKLFESDAGAKYRINTCYAWRDNARYYLDSRRGPVTQKRCIFALAGLEMAARNGDLYSSIVAGNVYLSGGLSRGFNHTVNVDLALHYYKLAWDGLQESRLKGRESRQIELDSLGKIKQLAFHRNPQARIYVAKIMEDKGDRQKELSQFAKAMDAYEEATRYGNRAVQVAMTDILSAAIVELKRAGSLFRPNVLWDDQARGNPQAMFMAANHMRDTRGSDNDLLGAVDLAKIAQRGGVAGAGQFIATMCMDLAHSARRRGDLPLAKNYAREAGRLGELNTQFFIESIEMDEALNAMRAGDEDVAKQIYSGLSKSGNAVIRSKAEALMRTMPARSSSDGVLVVRKTKGSIFRIETDSGLGTGFIVEKDIIATNVHVIDGAKQINAIPMGSREKFIVDINPVAIDLSRDLVLLRLRNKGINFSPLKLCDLKQVHKGQPVYAIGNPLGFRDVISKGIVAGKHSYDDHLRFFRNKGEEGDIIIQTTCEINGGNSGGPLVDARGRVVGVNTFKRLAFVEKGGAVDSPQGMNFAIAAEYLIKLIDDWKGRGRP